MINDLQKVNSYLKSNHLDKKDYLESNLNPYRGLVSLILEFKSSFKDVEPFYQGVRQLIPELNQLVSEFDNVLDEEVGFSNGNKFIDVSETFGLMGGQLDNRGMELSNQANEGIDASSRSISNRFEIDKSSVETNSKLNAMLGGVNLVEPKKFRLDGLVNSNDELDITLKTELTLLQKESALVGEGKGLVKDFDMPTKLKQSIEEAFNGLNDDPSSMIEVSSHLKAEMIDSDFNLSSPQSGGASVFNEAGIINNYNKDNNCNYFLSKDSTEYALIDIPSATLLEARRDFDMLNYPPIIQHINTNDEMVLPLVVDKLGKLEFKCSSQLEKIATIKSTLSVIDAKSSIFVQQILDDLIECLPYELQEYFKDEIAGLFVLINEGDVNQVRLKLFDFCKEAFSRIELSSQESNGVRSILDCYSSNSLLVGSRDKIESDVSDKLYLLEQKIFSKNNLPSYSVGKINEQLKSLLSGESDLAIMIIGSIAYLAVVQLDAIELNTSLDKLNNIIGEQKVVVNSFKQLNSLLDSTNSIVVNDNSDKISAISEGDGKHSNTKLSILNVIDKSMDKLDDLLLLTKNEEPVINEVTDYLRNDLQYMNQNQFNQLLQQRVAQLGSKMLEVNLFIKKQMELESKALSADIDEYLSDVDLVCYYIEGLSNFQE